MALRKLQDGTKGTIVIYHLAAANDETIKKAGEGWTIYNETFEGGKNLYYSPSPIEHLAHPLVLCGWSEGCQGVRAQLLRRILPKACIAADGIHAAKGAEVKDSELWKQQIEPWLRFGQECKAETPLPMGMGSPLFVVSATAIKTQGYWSTGDTLGMILPDGGSYIPLQMPDGSKWFLPPDSGNILIKSYPGTDAAAHIAQATKVLPLSIAEVCNPGGSYEQAHGMVKDGTPVKPVTPKPPVVGPVKNDPPSPGPVKPVSSSGGSGAFLAAAAIGIGFAVSRSRK